MEVPKNNPVESRKRLEAYYERMSAGQAKQGKSLSQNDGAREAFFIDEDTLSVKEMELLSGSCDEYSELEEMWLLVKDKKDLPADSKEEWIGFTYLLMKGVMDDFGQRGVLRSLRKKGQILLANAVEVFLERSSGE